MIRIIVIMGNNNAAARSACIVMARSAYIVMARSAYIVMARSAGGDGSGGEVKLGSWGSEMLRQQNALAQQHDVNTSVEPRRAAKMRRRYTRLNIEP